MAIISYDYTTNDYFSSTYFANGIEILWDTFTIFVPREALTLVQSNPIEVRELSITDFHESLRDIEDRFDGIVFPTTHNYVGPISISGVSLAQSMIILDPYTVTFEDGEWAVNITGGNSNIADRVNINNVGVRTANSAGLVDNSGFASLSEAERIAIAEQVWRTDLPLP